MMMCVTLAELPAPLVAVTNEATMHEMYHLPERGRFIVRHVLPDGRNEELEYDATLGRCLTLAERAAELPPARRALLSDRNVTISSTYFIDPTTCQLLESFQAIDESGQKLVDSVRLVYVKTAWDDRAEVQSALQQRAFPAEYATWSRAERIGHWAYAIHRWRRVHGESGRNEDEIYTPDLVTDLERIEPKLRDMLGEILAEVGWLEQTPAAEAIAAFTTRTGIAVRP
jgi:hypothetical protein